ncbi:hypothetical protein HCX49_21815 [Sphingobacterium kitahiroshimense]|uniref:hypothetical protein n=1 Tax=Sphingobacterium sp. B16(2022) TaxID=2914044 RepID=UPI00143B3BB4|nr:hypothetical protein [Sphingobacterium sp. B16(2022)]NJI75838.1 hypothetical protein [Sphingobacterium sp. B16(2022)]
MAFNDILDRQCKIFFNDKFEESRLIHSLIGPATRKEPVDKALNTFLQDFKDESHLEYIALKTIEYLDNLKLKINNSEEYVDIDKYFIDEGIVELTDRLKLRLHNIGANLKKEVYTKEEFEDLLSKIDKIAESLFSFQQKSDIANEIIYDSVDQIREQLKAQAEKGKIFGKEFVEQQLAGKVMDMAFKGSFFAMLSYAPEQISDIADHVKGLL